jgi:hypothetical protein
MTSTETNPLVTRLTSTALDSGWFAPGPRQSLAGTVRMRLKQPSGDESQGAHTKVRVYADDLVELAGWGGAIEGGSVPASSVIDFAAFLAGAPFSLGGMRLMVRAFPYFSLANLKEVLAEGDDEVVAMLQDRLRAGDAALANELARIASPMSQSSEFDTDQKALVLEVLSAAQVPEFEHLVARLILETLGADDVQLKIAAIAAIGDLPSHTRDSLFSAQLDMLANSASVPPALRSAARAAVVR